MLVFIEGVTKTGKTTLCKNLQKKSNDILYYRGFRPVCENSEFAKYAMIEHFILEKFATYNKNKIILCDRALSSLIYQPADMSLASNFIMQHFDNCICIILTRNKLTEQLDIEQNKYKQLGAKYSKRIIYSIEDKSENFVTNDILRMIQFFINGEIN